MRLPTNARAIQNAAPAAVLPATLCRAFVREQQVPVVENEYPDCSSQRKALATTSRKRSRLSKRLTPAQLAELRAFHEARQGGHQAFYFYDPCETVPKFSSDPTGQSPEGRYVGHFDGTFSHEIGMGRANLDITLIQLAYSATPKNQ